MNDILKIVKLLGRPRAILLGILLVLNTLVLLGWLLALDPMLEEAQGKLSAEEGKVAELTGKISGLKQEVAYVNQNLPQYKKLQESGLFLNQDRFAIGQMMEDIRKKTTLDSFSFNVDDLKEIPNQDAAKAKLRLVKSRISVQKLNTFYDGSIYTFLQNIPTVFPEMTRIQKFEIKKTKDVTETSLKEIVDGKPVSFVEASIDFDWITLLPKKDDTAEKPGAKK